MDPLKARLDQYGLGKYADLLAAERIDLDVLADLTDADLEKLGVPMGDRRRFLKADWGGSPARPAAAPTAAPEPQAGRLAERRQLTVMFADLVDSTKLAARLDPEDMQALIARYQKAVGAEVARFGGYVAKPLGDGLLIYFGWPQAHEDDAARAVRSALAAIAAVRRLATPDGAPVAARIGIATGEVVVGDFSDAGVDESGAVVGETPNLAARLQSVAAENAVVVAEATMRLIGRQFVLADLGGQTLKGFDKPVGAWRVESERTAESRFDAMHGARLGAFVGRAHEIGMLLHRWEEAREGECQLVLVAGEAGIGKSRLVAECLNRVGTEARRIAYQGSPLHINTALYPVVRQIQSRAGFAAEDSPAEKWAKLDALLAGPSPRRPLALQFLADLMSLEVPAAANGVKANPDEQKEAAFEVLSDFARAQSEAAPLLLVVEDAHWLDATTQELIERMLDRLQRCPAMVLVTYRPEFVPPWAQHANVGLLSLSRLGKRDARAIVNSLVAGGQKLSPEVAEDIVAKGDGIPLFVQELTGSVLESARGTDDRNIQIPSTLRDALSERLDRLGSAKEVAQIGAAFGREFSVDLVAATLDRSEEDLRADLERLKAIDVVFQSSRSAGRYTFHHALLQEAAYESMLKSKRREVHARIAEVLGERHPEMADTEPEVLATHYARAGDDARAGECWRKAGLNALRNSAYREAIGSFTNALPLLSVRTRADTHRAAASAYFAVADHASVRQHLEMAAADAEAAGDQVLLAEIVMQQSHDLIHYGATVEDAVRYGERALEIATRLDDDALAYGARFSLGQASWLGGDFPTAIRFMTANLPENLRDPERVRDFGTIGSLMMDSMCILGASLAYLGRFGEALASLDRAQKMVSDGAFDVSVVWYHYNRALLQRGDAATVAPRARVAIDHAARSGLRFTIAWLEGVLGYALLLLGEREDGMAALERAVAGSEALHQPTARVRAIAFLAEALAVSNPERAQGMTEEGLEICRALGYRAQEAEMLRVKAALEAATDPAGAVALANAGLALARQLGMGPEEGHALRSLAGVHERSGDPASARQCRDEARAIYAGLDMQYWLDQMAREAAQKTGAG